MNDIIKNIEAEQLKENAPEFHVGDTVKVYGKIKEGNRERIQVFEGTVLKKQGGSTRATFTVSERYQSIKRANGRKCCWWWQTRQGEDCRRMANSTPRGNTKRLHSRYWHIKEYSV